MLPCRYNPSDYSDIRLDWEFPSGLLIGLLVPAFFFPALYCVIASSTSCRSHPSQHFISPNASPAQRVPAQPATRVDDAGRVDKFVASAALLASVLCSLALLELASGVFTLIALPLASETIGLSLVCSTLLAAAAERGLEVHDLVVTGANYNERRAAAQRLWSQPYNGIVLYGAADLRREDIPRYTPAALHELCWPLTWPLA